MAQPNFLPSPFAASGDKNAILTADDGTQRASYPQGFPPITSLPPELGGIAPERKDFNGILNILSQFACFQQAGGTFAYSATQDYDPGAVVSDGTSKLYVCKVANGPGTGAGVKALTDGYYWGALFDEARATIVTDNSANLNTYMTPGWYFFPKTLTSVTGLPDFVSGGWLHVVAAIDTSGGSVVYEPLTQEFFDIDCGAKFRRINTDRNAAHWSAWEMSGGEGYIPRPTDLNDIVQCGRYVIQAYNGNACSHWPLDWDGTSNEYDEAAFCSTLIVSRDNDDSGAIGAANLRQTLFVGGYYSADAIIWTRVAAWDDGDSEWDFEAWNRVADAYLVYEAHEAKDAGLLLQAASVDTTADLNDYYDKNYCVRITNKNNATIPHAPTGATRGFLLAYSPAIAVGDPSSKKLVQLWIDDTGFIAQRLYNSTFGAWQIVADAAKLAAFPKSASGVGQWKAINYQQGGADFSDSSFDLPADGTWAYAVQRGILGNDVVPGQGGSFCGVAAGGTTITPGIDPNWTTVAWRGFAWRIA